MNIKIRQEQKNENQIICDLIVAAFADVQESDHREQYLVERMHKSNSFIPQLSLVAEIDNQRIVGYILLTEVDIVSDDSVTVSLGVAPLAVLPEFQGMGIGGLLLKEAHKIAAMLGYGVVVLLGHKDYYPRFGYCRAIDYGIKFPFDVSQDLCMVVGLTPDALIGVHGTVRYPEVFFE